MSTSNKGKQNLKQSEYIYLKIPIGYKEIVLEELALSTMKGENKVIEAINNIEVIKGLEVL